VVNGSAGPVFCQNTGPAEPLNVNSRISHCRAFITNASDEMLDEVAQDFTRRCFGLAVRFTDEEAEEDSEEDASAASAIAEEDD